MGRPTKQGIDFFSLDVQFDDKVELFLLEKSAIGLAVFITLLQIIYQNEGYYTVNGKDLVLLIKKRINVDINEINSCIRVLLERNILHKKLYEKYKILTSSGIQKRFFDAAKRKKKVRAVEEYLIIDRKNYENIQYVNINMVNVEGNEVSVGGNATKEKEEEKEEEKNKILSSEVSDGENPNPKPDPPEKKEKIFSSDSVEYRLSEKLRDLIHNRDPSAKNPNLQKWAKDIDLLHRVDNRSFGTIEDVIEWCQEDSFWQSNILSPGKLRSNFQQLYLKMKNNGNGKKQSKGGFISDHSGKKYEGTPPEQIPWLLPEEDENVSLQ